MKHFINDRERIVTDAIDATIALGQGRIARLDGFPAIKVVVRTDWDRAKDHVALVSGGGSGHEPSHAGFVGDGMLTAAVCGEIFASPSVDAVLAGILAVSGSAGCLLIVKSYTGDRLNFGLAAERARALGIDVEMVIVGDDIALPDAIHPRGVAGTLFVHKIAGHLARSGESLNVVKEAAERVAKSVVSLGLSLSSCTIPGKPTEVRMMEDEVELGLGIHGEPGVSLIAMQPIADLAATMAERIDNALHARGTPSDQSVALLVNDLGGVPPIEMAIATNAILQSMRHDVALVLGPDRLMTSLDMKGFSISALPLTEPIMQALLSDVGPNSWPHGRSIAKVDPIPLPEAIAKQRTFTSSTHPAHRRALEVICDTLIAQQSELDALDAKVGDGDTGSTLATAARAIRGDLDQLPLADPSALCASLADRLSKVMGGSSGVLLAIFTAAMAALPGAGWPAMLQAGVQRMQEYGGAKAGDRTMLDALVPAVTALENGEGLAGAARAARHGADSTATMTKARAGRSSAVREDALRGIPDPGAVAIATVFEALAK